MSKTSRDNRAGDHEATWLWFRLMRCASCLALGLWVGMNWVATSQAAPPNVVLFLVDDMGWMDSTPYGSQYYVTPNTQRLAEQSMRFTDAYALPLCSPTRASILTGQYSSRHGITSASGHQPPQPEGFEFMPKTAPPNQPLRMPISKNYLDPSHHTLAEALRDAGYRTGHFGKWHLGLTEPHFPEQHGFDVAWHCQPSPGPPGLYFSPYGVVPPGTPRPTDRREKYIVGTITDGPDGEYITDRLTDEAVAFIESNRDRPFFLNLWQFGVHGPWGHKEEITAELAPRTDPTGRQANPVMASMLKSVDESLGRVMDKLDELGIAENTLLIFYSDNGGNTHSNTEDDAKGGRNAAVNPAIASYRKWAGYLPPTNNAPLREGKGRIYEGGQRVPLMVRWPGRIPPGTTTDAVAGPIDIYPTILDALGLAKPAQQVIDGESLMPVLTQSGELKRDAYFTWFPHLIPSVSVRQGDWKLIRRFQPHPKYPEVRELYNLKDDIGETHNLAQQMPQKVKELDDRIDRFVAATGALYPQPNPDYRPSAARAARAAEAGLVPKLCSIEVIDGTLRVTPNQAQQSHFLGTAQVKHHGPLQLELRMRSQAAGTGKVSWKTESQDDFPFAQQSEEYVVEASPDWQVIKLTLPIDGKSAIIRLYLPDHGQAVDIQSIIYRAPESETVLKQWRF